MAREKLPLSLIMCDVDFFKLYNDQYGHLQGDACLSSVAHAIDYCIRRPADLAARYGGEEFVVLLPNTQAEGAVFVAESIRRKVQELVIDHAASPVCKYVTLSLGVASTVPGYHENPQTFKLLIARFTKPSEPGAIESIKTLTVRIRNCPSQRGHRRGARMR